MGNIARLLGRTDIANPDGWNPGEGQFNLPFTVELKEDFHIHWQDIRLEMEAEDFDDFATAIKRAHDRWDADGKPRELDETKRYGWWPGEEGYDFEDDRDEQYNEEGELTHHFRTFPKTEHGELYYDNVFQVELQMFGAYHLHYRNLRIEMGEERLNSIAKVMAVAAVKNKVYRYFPKLYNYIADRPKLVKFLKSTGMHGFAKRIFERMKYD